MYKRADGLLLQRIWATVGRNCSGKRQTAGTCTCMCLCVYVVMCFVQQLCPGDVVADKLRMFFFCCFASPQPKCFNQKFQFVCLCDVEEKKMDEPTKNGAMGHVFSSSQKKKDQILQPPLPIATIAIRWLFHCPLYHPCLVKRMSEKGR